MSSMDFLEYKELNRAKTRCWGIWISHLLLAPVASCVYAAKTNNWLPTAVATGVAVIGLPLAVMDLGFTTGVAAPITSAAMLTGKVCEARRKRGVLMAEEAEQRIFKQSVGGNA